MTEISWVSKLNHIIRPKSLLYISEFTPDSTSVDFPVVNTNQVKGARRRRMNHFLSAEKSLPVSLPMPKLSL